MDDPIVISLVVSGIGMLMLFLALVFLYVLMYLMTWITNIQALIKDRPAAVADGQRDKGTGEQRAMRWRAAVIAVALARAEQELGAIGAPEAEGTSSPWRALHHQRQLTLNRPTRRVR